MRYPLFLLLHFETQVFRCGNFVKHLDKQAFSCYTNLRSRGSGGTGRRARLRGVWITPYGFKSRLPHQTKAASFWMVPLFLVWMQGLEGCVLKNSPGDCFSAPPLRPQAGKSRLPHQNTGIAHRVMPVFFDLCETGLEGCVLEKRPVDVFPELRKQSRRHRSARRRASPVFRIRTYTCSPFITLTKRNISSGPSMGSCSPFSDTSCSG